MIHGQNPYAPVLLSVLGLTSKDVPRYRDCWWTGDLIAIHTRTGGGNRDEYENENDQLCAMPTFVRDEDDAYDSTYATFYFKMPEAFAWVVPSLQAETLTAEQRWEAFMSKLRDTEKQDDPQVVRALAIMKPLADLISQALESKKD